MSDWTIKVDEETCIGCQSCYEEAPGTFRMGEDNIAKVLAPSRDEHDVILRAAKSCPVDAITVMDAGGKRLWPK